MTLEKIFGVLENKDGFMVSNYYDKNYDYIIDVKVPESIRKYQGNYKYTLYKLEKNSWRKKEEKVIDKSKNEFIIKVSSVRNKNVTWKVKLELINASKIDKSFAPSNWSFVDSKDAKKYAYNIFTVKGYYSPVDNRDVNIKDSSKISVTTPKNNPRKFIIDLKSNTGNIKVYYTDSTNKKNKLEKIMKHDSKCIFTVPNSEKITYVTIKYETTIDSIKPTSWVKDNNYIVGKYTLKPETSYNN